jgi:hypothetical protein
MLKVYLAGKMNGLSYAEMSGWRNKIYEKLNAMANFHDKKINVVNPVLYYNFEEKRHQSEVEVEEFDLAHVVSSNIIIVNLDGLKNSIGTIIELHDAHYHHKIPVIAFGNQELYADLHPWIKNDITRIESNIDEMLDYIEDFYLR